MTSLERALDADPDLAEELELISGLMSARARAIFWSELARRCGSRRLAAAVLPALEAAAGASLGGAGSREERAPPGAPGPSRGGS